MNLKSADETSVLLFIVVSLTICAEIGHQLIVDLLVVPPKSGGRPVALFAPSAA